MPFFKRKQNMKLTSAYTNSIPSPSLIFFFQQQIMSLCKVQLNWDIAFPFSRPINWWTWTETFKFYNYLLENLTFVINNLGVFPVNSLIRSFPDVNFQSTFDFVFYLSPTVFLGFFFPYLETTSILFQVNKLPCF